MRGERTLLQKVEDRIYHQRELSNWLHARVVGEPEKTTYDFHSSLFGPAFKEGIERAKSLAQIRRGFSWPHYATSLDLYRAKAESDIVSNGMAGLGRGVIISRFEIPHSDEVDMDERIREFSIAAYL